jgi:hypothetical protein
MKLSQHERQILEEIKRGMRAEDPEFFASMTDARSRRGASVWGSLIFLAGLVALLAGAVLAHAMPGWGVAVSLIGFLAMFRGLWLLCFADRPLHRQGRNSALRRRVARLRDSMNDPPGMSP